MTEETKQVNYSWGLSYPDETKLIADVLKLVADKNSLFTLIDSEIISHLLINDFVDIDLDNETMEGTELTSKGYKYLADNI